MVAAIARRVQWGEADPRASVLAEGAELLGVPVMTLRRAARWIAELAPQERDALLEAMRRAER